MRMKEERLSAHAGPVVQEALQGRAKGTRCEEMTFASGGVSLEVSPAGHGSSHRGSRALKWKLERSQKLFYGVGACSSCALISASIASNSMFNASMVGGCDSPASRSKISQ